MGDLLAMGLKGAKPLSEISPLGKGRGIKGEGFLNNLL